MLAYQHSGFSVDAGVCIQSQDRAGLERLLRYCARPPFAMDRLRQRGADLVYHCPKPQTGGKQADLVLTPLELIARIAALVPPPRTGHAPPPLLWCAGAELATAGCSDGPGAGGAGASPASPGSSKCRYRRCAWCSPAACTRTRQALPGALPAGDADRQNLRGFSTGVPDLRRADAPHRVHHRWCRGVQDPGARRSGLPGPAHIPGARATALGRL